MEELGWKGKAKESCLQILACYFGMALIISTSRATSTAARLDVYTNHVGQMDEPLHATNEMPCAIESNTFHLGAGQLGWTQINNMGTRGGKKRRATIKP